MTKLFKFVSFLIFFISVKQMGGESRPVFLPIIEKSGNFLGVISETPYSVTKNIVNQSRPIGFHIVWAWGEPSPGEYDFSIPDSQIGELCPTLLVVKASPSWALDAGQPACMLPKELYWDSLVDYIQMLIDRYHPEKISVWNEPFAKNDDFPYNFGCYADGETYGRLVAYIYNHVHGAEIIIGNVANIYNKNVPIMLEVAQENFDVFGFHCYAYYYHGLYHSCDDQYQYAQNITAKPIAFTEVAVIYRIGSEQGYRNAQTDFFAYFDSHGKTAYWYTVCCNGWPPESLFTSDLCSSEPHLVWPACALYEN